MGMSPGEGSDPTLCEINVTPMVDVMLVLLIIFMVTAPLMQQGVDVDLPQTRAQPLERTDEDNLRLSIRKDRKIFISSKGSLVEVALEDLEEKLRHNEKLKQDKEIFLEADRSLPYGFVVDVMAKLKPAGVEQLNMVTESPAIEDE